MTAETNGPEPRLKQIFADALERQNAPERDQYLTEACGGDAKLRAQVEALLKAHAQASGFLDQTVLGEPGELLAEGPGTVIGRYKLMEKIGEGGFGSVYVAEQEEPVRRRVALKIIKLGMDTRQVVARFEAERQALAMMDHPNIARVYDAGSTDSGRPYFVMELVRGTRITEYCDRERLDPEQRLKLFVEVCHAIQHAHQKGIIHRDLKPSNILVSLQDGTPVPKVIDFGIAKATEGRLTDKTLYTAWEQFIGTPAYISPEQAKLTGVDVDTRSDIYSLGVLLYELLTGRTPFNQKELLQAGVDEMRRIIREVEPTRPSARLSMLEKVELDTVARTRCLEAPKLVGLLHGDLDWIVMKCLEKDRGRRFATANGLAEDLERHLAHEPVQARPPSRAYQFRKWARRHRVAFAAGSAVAVALAIAAVISVLWGVSEQANSQQLQVNLARQYLHQGQALAEKGSLARGMHWIVRAMEELPEGNPEMERAMAGSLAAWSERWVEPENVLFHEGWVSSVGFSPDGQWVATGGSEMLKLWSTETGHLVWKRQLPAGSADDGMLRFSPDGTRLLVGGGEVAALWSVRSGEPVGVPMEHHGGSAMKGVLFSPDGKLVLTGHNRDGTVRLWSGETGKPVFPPMEHGGRVYAIAFSPDGKLVLSGGWEGTVRLWSTETGKPVGEVLMHGEPVFCAAFSPDGNLAAAGGGGGLSGSVRLWSVATHEQVGPAMRHADFVYRLAFSPDGTKLLTGSGDHTARLWSTKNGEPVGKVMRHEGTVMDVSFSPDGQRILTAAADTTARLWSAENGEPIGLPMRHEEDGWVYFGQFSPKGDRLLTVPAGRMVLLWSDRPRSLGVVKLDSGMADAIAFSPDTGAQVATGNQEGTVKIWSADRGYTLEHEVMSGHPVWTLAYSPNGKQLLVGGENCPARVWDTQTWKPTGIELPCDGPKVFAGGFSPDGRLIATGEDSVANGKGSLKIWSAVNGDLLVGPLQHPDDVKDVAFSPDSSWLVTACVDGTARIWSVAEGKELFAPLRHSDGVTAVAISPDGQLIATASSDHRARLWDARTGKPTGIVLRHEGQVYDIAFSPDGRWLLTAGEIWNTRLWSVATGERIGPGFRSRLQVRQVAFTPDGTRIGMIGPFGAEVWQLPRPLPDPLPELERWRVWVECITRMSRDADGVVLPLPNDEWLRRKQRLDELGGPPVPPVVRSDERVAGSDE